MNIHILKIVLWPRRGGMKPREISFERGMVNVISGGPKAGKSAIIPIIDYCLGADTCAIPVGVIRDKCAWYGLVLASGEDQIFVARRDPGDQKVTGDMHISVGKEVVYPTEYPVKNATSKQVKEFFDDRCGLPSLGFESAEFVSSFRGRPSFRDMMAFCFQPQNIIANPAVLFFKADTYEHQEKLRAVLPFVLGSVSIEELEMKERLESARRELRRLEASLEQRESVRIANTESSYRLYAQALASGLVDQTNNSEDVIASLRTVAENGERAIATRHNAFELTMTELTVQRAREKKLSDDVSSVRRRLKDIRDFRSGWGIYTDSIASRTNRLGLAESLRDETEHRGVCPICENPIYTEGPVIDSFISALAASEKELESVQRRPETLDKQLLNEEQRERELWTELERVRDRIEQLESNARPAGADSYTSRTLAELIGRIKQTVETSERSEADDNLRKQVDDMRSKVDALVRRVGGGSGLERMRGAKAIIGNRASEIATSLDAEWPNSDIELLEKELTLKVSHGGRDNYLWEIGSGSNWVAYHLAIMLALQEYFIDVENSPVPSFLVVDQPSQVYFPREGDGADRGDSVEHWTGDRVEKVRRIYQEMGESVSATGNRLQMIVMDHAGSNVWGALADVALAAEFQETDKLVPSNW